MTTYRSEFLQTMAARGFIHQCTDPAALDAALAERAPRVCYIGFDCTADSLHVGSLIQIMLLRWWQNTGHRPIVLMGGGTTKVGDPSGKDESRQLLSEADIARNKEGIKGVFSQFLTFGGGGGARGTGAIMADNAEWLDGLGYIPFLRDYGRHFSVNRMLSFDSVKLRLDREQPLTFLEFNYMVLQAYDFLELYRRHACILQMGGSDQWGNIVNGVELTRRVVGAEIYGLTTPLITTSSGEKMGKTGRGAVWLNADKLAPYDYYQFWRNTADGDVGRFLRLFTELPLAEISRLEKLRGAELNEAKKVLAFAATKLCHGEAAAKSSEATARATFEEGGLGADLPRIRLSRSELAAGVPAFKVFVSAGLAASNGEARRLIKQGGGRINDQVIAVETQPVTLGDLKEGVIKISAGSKRHALIEPA